MNLIIQVLIFTSFFFEAGIGLFIPVFAVFITQQIPGADVAVVGYAAGIYWILKSILQIPVGVLLDKKRGEDDDFWALFAGCFITGLSVFLYIFAHSLFQIYGLQALLALGGALMVPSWYGMFLRHADKKMAGFEWSVNSSLSYGLGTGAAGALGGYLAKIYGFNLIFVLGAFMIWASMIILLLFRYRLPGYKHRHPIPKPPYPL